MAIFCNSFFNGSLVVFLSKKPIAATPAPIVPVAQATPPAIKEAPKVIPATLIGLKAPKETNATATEANIIAVPARMSSQPRVFLPAILWGFKFFAVSVQFVALSTSGFLIALCATVKILVRSSIDNS